VRLFASLHLRCPHRAPVEGQTHSGLGRPIHPVRGLRPSGTCWFRRCVRGMRWPSPFLRPFPPRSPPPTCRPVLFEASSVLCSLLRPSDPASAPRLPEPTRDRQGGCGRPEVSQVPTRSLTARTGPRWSPRRTVPHMLPAAVRSASASTVRVFRSSIQSSLSRCVRFAVADDPATLATGRALPPSRSTGWSFAWRTRTDSQSTSGSASSAVGGAIRMAEVSAKSSLRIRAWIPLVRSTTWETS
jgi:hypothetical protein